MAEMSHRARVLALLPPLSRFPRKRLLFAVVASIATSLAGWSIVTNLGLLDTLHDPAAQHVDQNALLSLVQAGRYYQALDMAVEGGDRLFETEFNALDGGGANVGGG